MHKFTFVLALGLGLLASTSVEAQTNQDSAEAALQDKLDSIEHNGKYAEDRMTVLQHRLDSIEQHNKEKEEQAAFDERQNKMWKYKKFIKLAYITSQNLTAQDGLPIDDEGSVKLKSKFGVSWTLFGRTWYLHKKALANMLKFGLDMDINMNYAKYKNADFSGFGNMFDDLEDWDDYDDYGYDYGYGYGNDDEEESEGSLGVHQIEVGVGLGPSATISPLYFLGKKNADAFQVTLFYHLIPSFSGILRSANGDHEFNSAFVMNQSFGFALSWKKLSLGFETRWGKAKYKGFGFDEGDLKDMIDDEFGQAVSDEVDTDDIKRKFKTTSSRLFIALRF